MGSQLQQPAQAQQHQGLTKGIYFLTLLLYNICYSFLCVKMDAIKKKMQAMRVEKDNACDRTDVCEEASKFAKIRAGKAEDEVEELVTKSRQLETELDVTNEKFVIVSLQLEEKEKSLLAAEAEMNALNGRVSGLEEDLEKTEEKLVAASAKLDKAGTAADDSE